MHTHRLSISNENVCWIHISFLQLHWTLQWLPFWQHSNIFFLLSALFSCLQWKNVWAPCRWAHRWWSSAVAPRDWCGSSFWTNTSPASAGGRRARTKRPRVSLLYLIATKEPYYVCDLLNKCYQTFSFWGSADWAIVRKKHPAVGQLSTRPVQFDCNELKTVLPGFCS